MNNYHIYEKIGHGKHSTVYKGRKKKTISYYAIKSVDKSQKARVLQEVRTMHALDHRNILKFYAWYETTNHLWLILEYCVGGDLMSLLRQDVRLPESSVHDFARDLVTALQYLHSKEIIYCDLKPSNILLDENGRMKLGGFGLSRRLADINKKPVQALAQNMRGTPCYMAPELFSEGATHSTVSDLWAIGCVLYECSMGRPPFLNSSFNQLVHEILNNEPQPIPGASAEYHDLIMRLLDKNPGTRIRWKELCEHPFWQVRLPVLDLPPEPALEAFIQRYGLLPTVEEMRQSTREGLKLDKGRVMRQSVDITRLSRIALHNLEREGEGADYSSAVGGAAAAEQQPGDIRIDSADAELDFEENREEGVDDETPASPAPSDDGMVIDQGSGGALGDSGRMITATANDAMMARAAAHQGTHGVHGPGPGPARRGGDGPTVSGAGAQGGAGGRPPTRGGVADQGPSSRSVVGLGRADAGAELAAAAGVGSGSGAIEDDLLVETELVADRDAASLEDLIWHPSDTAVKPIVANRRIERLPEPRYDAASLPFKPWTLAEMLGANQADLEAFLTHIYRAIASAAPLKDKVNVLSYFETLCVDTNAANVLINSSLTILFIRMLRNARAPTLRIRLASVLGLLVRHATYIAEELAATGVVEVLSEALKDKNERVRRRVIATLGELLFYIATQQQDNAAAAAGGAGAAPADPSVVWGITSNTYAQVMRLLKDKEDEVAAHYAVKTVENICSQGGEWASRFATQDVVLSLVQLINAQGRGEQLRATAASTLARLLRHSPTLVAHTVDKYGIRLFVGCLLDGTAGSASASAGGAGGTGSGGGAGGASGKVQTAALNLLNLTLAQADLSTRARASLAEERGLLPGLVGLLDHALPLLRAKALVTIMLLSRLSPRWLLEACKHKLMGAVERLAREKDDYLARAMAAMRAEASRLVPAIAASISEELGGRGSAGGVRRNSAGALVGPGGAGAGGGARPQPAKSPLALFPVVHHLLTSPHFRGAVVTQQLVGDLASWLTITSGPAAGGAIGGGAGSSLSASASAGGAGGSQAALLQDFKTTLMHVLEALCQQSELVLQHYSSVLNTLLPALCGVVSADAEGGDTRFFCLRMVSDVLQTLLLDEELYGSPQQRAEGGTGAAGGVAAAAIDRVLRSHILPLVPRLLRDEDPMPLYALKLLGGLLEINLAYVADVEAMGLAAQFFEFLSLEHSNNNVHNIRLCRQIIAAGSLPVAQLAELQVAEKVAAVLEYATNNAVEPFLEPVLELVNTILQRDALEVAERRSDGTLAGVFLEQAGVLLDNCAHPDVPVSSSAASAAASLVALFPNECAPWLLSPENASALGSVLAGQHMLQQPGGQQGVAAVPPSLQQPLLEALSAALAVPGAATSSDELAQLYDIVRQTAAGSQDPGVRTVAAEVAAGLGAAMAAH
ncbi:hypothetical protein HYH03_008674 [Edaphochlamys debaryana]|uniref:Protein kinase domain-containing protein n=1 Tax=Edaphochlamys debaryana TaxID=47281 RepID=A0A835Y2P7_9CHLO|nr:hypothetical protein HYH03_008674 [Edaphochlamys debaryana]|eukprot:KAG2493011.1 hypothetical protein HYH03_008674 [Edaphochlamys debaryana]